MTGADWAIVAVVVISTLLAAANGFFYELFSIAGVIIGFFAAAWGYHKVSAWFVPLAKWSWVADTAGFLTIFFAVVLLAGIVARITRWAMKEAGLRWFDRVLGAAFGVVRGVLVVAIILLATTTFAPSPAWLSNSQIAPYVLVVARGAAWAAPGEIRAKFHDSIDRLRDMRVAKEKKADTENTAKK